MDWKSRLVLGALSLAGGTLALHSLMTSEVSREDAEITYEPPQTSIVLPTYNEVAYISDCIISLCEQNIAQAFPQKFELIVVDSGSVDGTVEIAKNYTSNIIKAPKGKLTARDIGIRHAKGEIIVSVDADIVAPVNWLNLTLRHFQDEEVVAVGGPDIHKDAWVTIPNLWYCFVESLGRFRIAGSNSAFRRDAYFETGGFDLSIDQFNLSQLFKEEEFDFLRRLKQVGTYVYDLKASVFKSPRRMVCMFDHRTICAVDPTSPLCRYCLEVYMKQRFS